MSVVWNVLAIAVSAIFVVAIIGAIGALRDGPRPVPGFEAFRAAEDAAWARVRTGVARDMVVLRPTWVPPEFRDSPDCGPAVTGDVFANGDGRTGPSSVPTYAVRYFGGRVSSGLCAFLDFTGVPDQRSYTGFDDNLTDFGPLYVRGTVVWLRGARTGTSRDLGHYGPSEQLTYLWWNEGGATYEVGGVNVTTGELVQVLLDMKAVP